MTIIGYLSAVDEHKGVTKMKIAIPLFKERVSPHFGSSSRFLLLETDGVTVFQETTFEVGGEGPMQIAWHLVDLGVEEVICGGIQYQYKEWLVMKGVAVMDNKRGVAKEIIGQLLKDEESGVPT